MYLLTGWANGSNPWIIFVTLLSYKKMRTSNKQMKEECIRAWDYLQKASGLLLNADITKKAHKIMMDGKDVLAVEYRKSPVFLNYRIFPPADTIERLIDDALYCYYHPNDPIIDPILVAANLFVDLINIHPFEHGNGRSCWMILSHVVIDGCCGLFPVLLSSFNNRGRRYYIQAVNRYHENPSTLYTMIKSLSMDNFE